MEGYGAGTYGDRIASVYDELHAGAFDTAGTVSFLRDLAQEGPALELGVGTGRVALRLAECGVEVHGVDASPGMISKLRSRDGGRRVTATLADVAGLDLGRRYRLVYVVGNTIFAAPTAVQQLEWFRCARRHLEPGGAFVVEAFVAAPDLVGRGDLVQVNWAGRRGVMVLAVRGDAAARSAEAQQAVLGVGGVRLYPVRIRYAAPAELDLMARVAGLRLAARWAGWRRHRFDARATSHVSVYERR